MPFLGSGDLLVGSGPPRLLVIHMRLPWPLTFSSSLGDRLGNFMPPFLCKSQVGNDYLVFCLHAIEMLPAPILAAAVRRPLGGICIIGGAGCSLEDPTGIPLSRKCSEDAFRQLVLDGLLREDRQQPK